MNVYEQALEMLEEYGWTQGDLESPDGVCAMGAINYTDLPISSAEFAVAVRRAEMVLESDPWLFGEVPPEQENDNRPLARWNDAPERTEDDVRHLFKYCAQLEDDE